MTARPPIRTKSRRAGEDRGQREPSRQGRPEDLAVERIDPAADIGRAGHRQARLRRRRDGGERESGERSGVGGDVAQEVGGHGVADGVARGRVGGSEPPGERVEPEQNRREVRRKVPGQVVAAGVRQLVGEDRPQVVVGQCPGRQQQHRPPQAGEAGRRHLGRADDAHGRRADCFGHVMALCDDPPRGPIRAADDSTEPEPRQRQPGRQHRDPNRPQAEQRRDDPPGLVAGRPAGAGTAAAGRPESRRRAIGAGLRGQVWSRGPGATSDGTTTATVAGTTGTVSTGGASVSTPTPATPTTAARQRATRHRGLRPASAGVRTTPGPAAPSTGATSTATADSFKTDHALIVDPLSRSPAPAQASPGLDRPAASARAGRPRSASLT